jgi:hypothetical protein
MLAGTHEVILRDGGLCQVPGCSRAADHRHHITFRSAGGLEVGWNELGLCLPHHLVGIHQGYIHVSGRAPDQLIWVLGDQEVATGAA